MQTTNNKQDFKTALYHAKTSLRESITAIDELNGRLEELRHYQRIIDGMSESSNDSMQEIEDFYKTLPTWDCIEGLIEEVENVKEELQGGATHE